MTVAGRLLHRGTKENRCSPSKRHAREQIDLPQHERAWKRHSKTSQPHILRLLRLDCRINRYAHVDAHRPSSRSRACAVSYAGATGHPRSPAALPGNLATQAIVVANVGRFVAHDQYLGPAGRPCSDASGMHPSLPAAGNFAEARSMCPISRAFIRRTSGAAGTNCSSVGYVTDCAISTVSQTACEPRKLDAQEEYGTSLRSRLERER